MSVIETVTDLAAGAETLQRRRYGRIETRAGKLASVQLRPWPHLLSWPEIWPVGPAWRPDGPPDRCRLYYNQPRGHERFIALKYVACTPGTSYRTLAAALAVLDTIAAIKRVDALLCDAANERLSERFLRRWGWEPHAPAWRRRNYIRRFYGVYPSAAVASTGAC
ncbi:hypothetical protein [Botrimarina hoheduenensis]|uniref:N-acetyltransferase domain-containing protein n=1 Tax=Botrimarina hoheduenensis TaxID=2528000 RepID=A0A5C5WCP8_9BACT|nr:hypothetical protein [Botrimarina hoheduenensis]TWT48317.1 hypothetical protein Pla111_00800 [Botrimarina hoheduenensis]